MSLDFSFSMTPRGFDDVMACMEAAMPDMPRCVFEDAWASVTHCLTCARFWAAAGYGEPWNRVILRRLETLLEYGIWGASSCILAPHPKRTAECLVPTRCKKSCDGWQEIHGGSVYLCDAAVACRKRLAILAYCLSKRPAARQVMLWSLLAMNIVEQMRSYVDAQLRAGRETEGQSHRQHQSKSQC